MDQTPEETSALQAAIAAVRAAGFNVESEGDLERLRAPDQYEQELNVAAEVRAYFQVAYKVRTCPHIMCASYDCAYRLVSLQRIIDNIPRIIDQDFIKKLCPSIENALHSKLFSDEKVATKYMAEDPQLTEERYNLETKSAKLLDIENRLSFSVVEV